MDGMHDREPEPAEKKKTGGLRRYMVEKVAIARDGSMVSGHFGHCEDYALYTVSDSMISHTGYIPNPGHEPGKLPPYLASHGVNTIIAGGMGQRAIDLFHEQGIEVILGASGSIDLIAQEYFSGKLKNAGSACSNHDHTCSGH